jgi:8-oxo-dGTP diphosphatase
LTLSGPVSTCCACVLRDSRLLLIKRGQEPGKGNWSFPGGRIELGETILEAVKRETLEETGVEIAPLEVFQVYDWIVRDDAGGITFHYLAHYVHARYLSGEPRPRDDAVGVLWAVESDLARLQMHPFVRKTALELLRAASGSPRSKAPPG